MHELSAVALRKGPGDFGGAFRERDFDEIPQNALCRHFALRTLEEGVSPLH